ncbi:hypothetical protein [Streptomyces sp. LMG1-1-1.1]|uniref:hypothetical protein n=1 Tax=Streptomyces sp. LMG1-1-1.1 TaxID=3135245 RepID=UPI0034666CDB
MAKTKLTSVYAQWLATAYPEVKDTARIKEGAEFLADTSSEDDRVTTAERAEIVRKELSHILGCPTSQTSNQ